MSNQTKPAPPKIVIAPEGCNKNLTSGNSYAVTEIWDDWDFLNGYGFCVIDDLGLRLNCIEIGCSFLDYKDWIIKEREVSHD